MTAPIRSGLFAAALMIASALALVYLNRLGWVSGDRSEMSARSTNVILGLLVVWLANSSAKQLSRLRSGACNPEREQATRRFIAWSLALGGLAYAAIWLAAPYGMTFYLSISALGAATMLAVARLVALKVGV